MSKGLAAVPHNVVRERALRPFGVQVVFRLAAQLDRQVIHFNTDTMRYEPLEPPQALDPAWLAMLLPAAVAMQACTTLLIVHTQGH